MAKTVACSLNEIKDEVIIKYMEDLNNIGLNNAAILKLALYKMYNENNSFPVIGNNIFNQDEHLNEKDNKVDSEEAIDEIEKITEEPIEEVPEEPIEKEVIKENKIKNIQQINSKNPFKKVALEEVEAKR